MLQTNHLRSFQVPDRKTEEIPKDKKEAASRTEIFLQGFLFLFFQRQQFLESNPRSAYKPQNRTKQWQVCTIARQVKSNLKNSDITIGAKNAPIAKTICKILSATGVPSEFSLM